MVVPLAPDPVDAVPVEEPEAACPPPDAEAAAPDPVAVEVVTVFFPPVGRVHVIGVAPTLAMAAWACAWRVVVSGAIPFGSSVWPAPVM